jgi:hypothetical protein
VQQVVLGRTGGDHHPLQRREDRNACRTASAFRDQRERRPELRIQTFWSSQNRHHLWPVHADQNNNPVAEAFRMGRPLWLLDTKKEPLGEVGRYKDHWSGLTRMTAYQPSVPPVWTLLAVPLFCRRRLGIYFIEIPEYIERNNVATS